jgi:hypothetical protein
MRTALTLITSLVVALILCTALVATGVLDFGDEIGTNQFSHAGEKAILKCQNLLNAFLHTGKNAFEPIFRRKNTSVPLAANQATLEIPCVSGEDNDDFIHKNALAFLKNATSKDILDIEDCFTTFLIEELGVPETQTECIIRMAFWKNFVSLQSPLRSGELDEVTLEFAREKELKEAGFAAKGLVMMASEKEQAEKRLQALGEQFPDNGGGGGTGL